MDVLIILANIVIFCFYGYMNYLSSKHKADELVDEIRRSHQS